MMITVPVTKIRHDIGNVVSQVSYAGYRVVISRHGKPAAVLVSVEDAELLAALEDRIDLAAARKALREPGRVAWEKVKKDLGL